LIKKAKSMYYHNIIYNNKDNVKKLWETIKYVTNNSSNNSKTTVHSLINNAGINLIIKLFLTFLMITFLQ